MALLALVVATVFIGVLLWLTRAPSKPALASHATPTIAATLSPRDAAWHAVGLSADEQIVFARSDPQTAYSCGVANKTIVMHVSHDGGMTWQPLAFSSPIASETCLLTIDETNPLQLAIMTLVTKPDPCQTTMCTPTPCAGQCQPCMDYCPPPPQRTVTLYRSVDGGMTWKSVAAPKGLHFTLDLAFAGNTLYAWTDTWPTLLVASAAGGPFRPINLSAYFPASRSNAMYQTYVAAHFSPLQGNMYLPIPGGNYMNRYLVTHDGGNTWALVTYTMGGDPVVLRPASGLDGRTLMGERIHNMGYLVLSTDSGKTWQPAPAPYPDFSHGGLTQCYVTADGSFLWFNGFDPNFGLGIYRAGPGATAWTKLLDASQIQDVSVDLASYDVHGRLVALWGQESQTKWVVYRLP